MKTYTVWEAAEYCHCHPETVRKYIRTGKLIASKVGCNYCIRQVKLDEFLEQLENDVVQTSLNQRSEQKCQKNQTDCTSVMAYGTLTSESQVVSALDALLAPEMKRKPGSSTTK